MFERRVLWIFASTQEKNDQVYIARLRKRTRLDGHLLLSQKKCRSKIDENAPPTTQQRPTLEANNTCNMSKTAKEDSFEDIVVDEEKGNVRRESIRSIDTLDTAGSMSVRDVAEEQNHYWYIFMALLAFLGIIVLILLMLLPHFLHHE